MTIRQPQIRRNASAATSTVSANRVGRYGLICSLVVIAAAFHASAALSAGRPTIAGATTFALLF
jgi:hypothetical protein